MSKEEIKDLIENKEEISKEIEENKEKTIKMIEEIRGRRCYILVGKDMTEQTLELAFEDLELYYKDCDGRLDVLLDSYGGDMNIAYNLAFLFRKYGHKELSFIIPRQAKSAATILACAGDNILMTDIAELGPIDSQFYSSDPENIANGIDSLCEKDVSNTLDMIRGEFQKGSKEMAFSMIKGIPSPLLFSRIKRADCLAKHYFSTILKGRMLKDDAENADKIVEKISKGYPDHGFCINRQEAINMGLKAEAIQNPLLRKVWALKMLENKKEGIDIVDSFREAFEQLESEIGSEFEGSIDSSSDGHEGIIETGDEATSHS